MLDGWPCHKWTFNFRRDVRFSRARVFRVLENPDFYRFYQCILYNYLRSFSLWLWGKFKMKQMMIYNQITCFIRSFFNIMFWPGVKREERARHERATSGKLTNTLEHIATFDRKRTFTEDSEIGGTRPKAYFNFCASCSLTDHSLADHLSPSTQVCQPRAKAKGQLGPRQGRTKG